MVPNGYEDSLSVVRQGKMEGQSPPLAVWVARQELNS
jgi:hypothetical protein